MEGSQVSDVVVLLGCGRRSRWRGKNWRIDELPGWRWSCAPCLAFAVRCRPGRKRKFSTRSPA